MTEPIIPWIGGKRRLADRPGWCQIQRDLVPNRARRYKQLLGGKR